MVICRFQFRFPGAFGDKILSTVAWMDGWMDGCAGIGLAMESEFHQHCYGNGIRAGIIEGLNEWAL